MLLKENNPWRGLASYTYSDSKLFYGRERELESLLLSIRENYCTILYGVSGAGKTSLINAGLCPRLKKEGMLPVVVRFDHSSNETYSRQTLNRCLEELSLNDCEYVSSLDISRLAISDTDKLWLFFHTSTFWSARNEKITPCVFIDQFEEIFSLNQDSPDKISSFFEDFNQVYQSIPSDTLLSALNDNKEPLSFNDRPYFRLTLSMREDFLSSLEDYCQGIPFLRQNRRRLNKLTGEQALDVITKPLSGIVGDDAAFQIISKVSGRHVDKTSANLDKIEVDTSILSLFCTELYVKAIERGSDVISLELVQSQGDDILSEFYNNTVSRISKKAVRYLESHLLTSSGYRNQLALEDIDSSKVNENEIEILEYARLIRKEIINGTTRIEYSHDVLCKVASAHRVSTKEREKSGWDRVSSLLKWALSILWAWLLFRMRNSFLLGLGVEWIDERISFPYDDNAFICNLIILLIQVLFLVMYWGLLSLTSKKKNVWFTIAMFIAGVFFIALRLGFEFNFIGRLSYSISGNTRFLLSPWLILVTSLLAVFSLIHPAKKVSFSDALRNAVSLSAIKADPARYIYVFGSIIYLLAFMVYRATTIKLAALTLTTLLLLPLFSEMIMYLIKDTTSPRNGNKASIQRISAQAGVIVFFYLSLYTHIRLLSYISLAGLFIAGYYTYKGCFTTRSKGATLICWVLSIVIWLICPLNSLGFSLFSLGNNALATKSLLYYSHWQYNTNIWIPNPSFPSYSIIVSKDGKYGIISKKGVLLSPQFSGIQAEYKISDAEKAPFPTWNSELFYVKDATDSKYTPWSVMHHLDNDNWFTQQYLKSYYSKPYGVISTRNILNSYSNTSSPEFDDFACRLYLNELNFDLLLDSKNSFNNYPLYSYLINNNDDSNDSGQEIMSEYGQWVRRLEGRTNNMAMYRTDSLFTALSRDIKDNSKTPIGSLELHRAFDAISYESAFESALLRRYLEDIFKKDIDRNPYNWTSHSDLAQVYLKNGQYEEAEKEARTATQFIELGSIRCYPVVYIIESLILQEKYDEAESLLRRFKDCILEINNRDYYGYSYKTHDFAQPLSSCVYVGDLLIKDTARFSYSEEAQLFITSLLPGYGQEFRYSEAYYDLNKDKTLLCNNSSGPRPTSNWYNVTVRKGDYTSEVFERITLSKSSSLAVYFKGDKRGYLDLAGGDSLRIYPAIYEHAWVYSEGMAVVSKDNQLMFIDSLGRVKAKPNVPVLTDMDLVFKNGTLQYRADGYKYGLLGKDGKWVLSPEYDSIGESSYGFRLVEKDNLYGLIQDNGDIVVQPKYPHISIEEKYIRISLPDSDETLTYPIELTKSAEFRRTYSIN